MRSFNRDKDVRFEMNKVITTYSFIQSKTISRNKERAVVTVNNVRYRHILNTLLFPKMQELNIDISSNNMVLRPAQALKPSIYWNENLVTMLFQEMVPADWPPRSCDLTSPDYFLWRYVKSMVYDNKPTTLGASEVSVDPQSLIN